MTSRYPSSADLAAFRASIDPGYVCRIDLTDDAAMPYLRRDGIGWRRATSPASLIGWGYVNDDGRPRLVNVLDARREASAMRSRAYQSRWPGGARMERADRWPTGAR